MTIHQRALQQRFHHDRCTISELPRSGDITYNETTFTAVMPESSIHYEGRCSVDERTGYRRGSEGETSTVIQGAEVRIVGLPESVEVGMMLVLDRLPAVQFEIQEISSGTNELSRTLLVERTRQHPAVGAFA